MAPSLPPPSTCREFLGLSRGWCQSESTIWLHNEPFCGHHAVTRQAYEAETFRRNGQRLRGVA